MEEDLNSILIRNLNSNDFSKNFELIKSIKRIGKNISIEILRHKILQTTHLHKKIDTDLELLPKFYQDVIFWGHFQTLNASKNIQTLQYISVEFKKKGKNITMNDVSVSMIFELPESSLDQEISKRSLINSYYQNSEILEFFFNMLQFFSAFPNYEENEISTKSLGIIQGKIKLCHDFSTKINLKTKHYQNFLNVIIQMCLLINFENFNNTNFEEKITLLKNEKRMDNWFSDFIIQTKDSIDNEGEEIEWKDILKGFVNARVNIFFLNLFNKFNIFR